MPAGGNRRRRRRRRGSPAALLVVIGAGLAGCRSLTPSSNATGRPGAAESTASSSSARPATGEVKIIDGVDRQPLASQVERLIEALHYVGEPPSREDELRLYEAIALEDGAAAVEAIQRLLASYTLLEVQINPEGRVSVERGPAVAELVENGWRVYLVRVVNEAGVTGALKLESATSGPVHDPRANAFGRAEVERRWMQAEMFDGRPLAPELSGFLLEYRILQLYTREVGPREGHFAFNVGQGSQDIGFRNDLYVLFRCAPSAQVRLRVRDEDGRPTTAGFVIRDAQGRLYPLPAKRLAPDFHFHEQIYRADGETVALPPGDYEIVCTRGPEYLPERRSVSVPPGRWHELEFHLRRWIDPNALRWFSGDHHIHAAGCRHYHSPTQGVDPPDMLRQIRGEGLNVGCVLTWGPAWYHQKQFFSGGVHPLSDARHVLRYDVEVSGFPSDHTGHLCLLGLSEDDFPQTEEKQQWPSWGLPILRWAKSQPGAVVGVAHSGWGLDVFPEAGLPNYRVPPMNGIGAQEYLVDVAHDAVDFISAGDTPYVSELNIWYHALNCGFETRLSGETDFPCIYGDRVGMGRSYVRVEGPGLTFEGWLAGLQAGRSYVSDGLSHLMDFTVEGVVSGGRVALEAPAPVRVKLQAAAYLPELPALIPTRHRIPSSAPYKDERGRPMAPIRDLPYNVKPYWHVERARLGESRRVPVEVVVNGRVAARQEILADGLLRPVAFEVPVERSSWIAVRVLPSSHTNPVFVEVQGRPVRASKRSAQWCLDAIDQLWKQKMPRIREGRERREAEEAFEAAREVYRNILAEADDDISGRSRDVSGAAAPGAPSAQRVFVPVER